MDPAGSSPAELSSKLGGTQATDPPTQGIHTKTHQDRRGKHTNTGRGRHTKTGGEQKGPLWGARARPT